MRICASGDCGTCACCANKHTVDTPLFPTPAARRLALCSPFIKNAAANTRCVVRPLGYSVRGSATKRAKLDVATARVAGFIKLIKLCDAAPWANITFEVNDGMLRILAATHLHLIVGKDAYKTCNKLELLRLIDPSKQLDGLSNLVWVTNRQQGFVKKKKKKKKKKMCLHLTKKIKCAMCSSVCIFLQCCLNVYRKTTTLGKFIACLMVASPAGGDLVNVYATSLDRANELTKQAKQYIYYLKNLDGYRHLSVLKQNANTFILANGLATNTMVSRPKNADSCRGGQCMPTTCV